MSTWQEDNEVLGAQGRAQWVVASCPLQRGDLIMILVTCSSSRSYSQLLVAGSHVVEGSPSEPNRRSNPLWVRRAPWEDDRVKPGAAAL